MIAAGMSYVERLSEGAFNTVAGAVGVAAVLGMAVGLAFHRRRR